MAGKEKKQPEEQQKKVDEQPKEEKVEKEQEQPKEEKVEKEQEQPKEEQKKVDEQSKEQKEYQKEDIASIIKELKDTQTKQIAEMQASYDAKLKERDDIIKQLIKGEKATNEGTNDVAELVNKTRNYKKW